MVTFEQKKQEIRDYYSEWSKEDLIDYIMDDIEEDIEEIYDEIMGDSK